MYSPKLSLSFLVTLANLLSDNFSPILAVLATIKSLIVPFSYGKFKASSTVLASLLIIVFNVSLTNSWNSAF